MNNSLEVIILGILQGLTEFLPVSSSGHLVLAEHIMGIKQPGVALEVVLHLGTLVSILIYYRRSIMDIITPAFKTPCHSIKQMSSNSVCPLLLVLFLPVLLACSSEI